MIGGSPTGGQLLVGMLFVIAGCLGASITVELARRSRNWLYLVSSLGFIALLAGIVGQRTPRLDSLGKRIVEGPWDAGVAIPVVNLQVTPVALGGVLVALVGTALVLFLEPVPQVEPASVAAPPRALTEDDTV